MLLSKRIVYVLFWEMLLCVYSIALSPKDVFLLTTKVFSLFIIVEIDFIDTKRVNLSLVIIIL